MPKKSNPWMIHLAKFRKANPGMDPKKVMGAARATYKKQTGGNWLDDLGGFVGQVGQAAAPFAPLMMGLGRRRVAGMPSRLNTFITLRNCNLVS